MFRCSTKFSSKKKLKTKKNNENKVAVARAWCVASDDAKMIIDVGGFGKDKVFFNREWRYGRVRYPHLAANWQLIQGIESTFLFEKLDAI